MFSSESRPILLRNCVQSTDIEARAATTQHCFSWCVLLEFLDPSFGISQAIRVRNVVNDTCCICVSQVHPVEHQHTLAAWKIKKLKLNIYIPCLKALHVNCGLQTLRRNILIRAAASSVRFNKRSLACVGCTNDDHLEAKVLLAHISSLKIN